MPFFDADGNEVEGVLPPDEATKLQEQVKTFEEKAKQAEQLEVKLKEKEDELMKLSSKDYNFKKLRERSEEEIEEMKKKMSEKEKAMLTEVMETRRELDGERNKRFEETKDEVLKSLAGDDKNLRDLIEVNEKELNGTAKTPKELEERYRKAYILAKGESPKANPLFSGYASSYREPSLKKVRFTDTPEGQALFAEKFPKLAAMEKKN
jgi:myosin heavy subunit